MTEERNCRVCGYYDADGEAPWALEDGQLFPSYEICPCCGAEHGFDDDGKAGVIWYRVEWLRSGAPFIIKHLKPKNWNIQMAHEQLKSIPDEWW